MGAVEYLDKSIAGEGFNADTHNPGAWMDAPAEGEWQPDIEAPHINDYAAFKKHKHYGKYFKPHVYRPFPAWMYRAGEEKLVKNKDEATAALADGWSPNPPKAKKIDMTGKSLPVKSETQKLAEVIAATAAKQGTPGDVAATVAAVMAALAAAGVLPKPEVQAQPQAQALPEESRPDDLKEDAVERAALIELAEKEKVKIDKRWSNARIKEALGI